MHLSDGTLRRWIDEPLSLDAAQRRHLDACDNCRARTSAIKPDAERAAVALAVQAPAPDVDAALVRFRARAVSSVDGESRTTRMRAPRRARGLRWAGVVAVAAALSVGLVVSGAAQSLFTIFQPTQFSAVPVTAADVSSLLQLSRYGVVSGVPTLQIAAEPDAAAGARAAGVVAPVPSAMPRNVTGPPHYAVISGGVVSFTFSAARARTAAQQQGATLPPMPANIDGTTLTLTVPPVLVVSYGGDLPTLLHESVAAGAKDVLLLAVERAPTVTSTGATASELEQYLLAQPAVPSDLAAEIRALGNPSATVPVPIPVDETQAQQVDVNGSSGLLIGDSSGAGSLLVWERDGVIRAVAGGVTSDQVLAVGRSLG
ncbi:MAG TPA: hypothetical protein VEY89_09070 [Candidatus Dormibacteraeota bacterium]|nr:hypothetical protein [Candidatus Dormibacteraeota bacterium]